MTETELLNSYILKINNEKEKIKNDIKSFFEENKNDANVFFLTVEKFEKQIRNFEKLYNMSIPKQLVNSSYGLTSYVESINTYLDLTRYPEKLWDDLQTTKKKSANA